LAAPGGSAPAERLWETGDWPSISVRNAGEEGLCASLAAQAATKNHAVIKRLET